MSFFPSSMVPNVTFLILNGVVGHRFKTLPRLVISLIFVILSFIFTSIMVQVGTVDTSIGFSVTRVSLAFILLQRVFRGS